MWNELERQKNKNKILNTMSIAATSSVQSFRIIYVCGASHFSHGHGALGKRDADHRVSPWNTWNEYRRCAIAWAACHHHQIRWWIPLFSRQYILNGEVGEPDFQVVLTNRAHLRRDRICFNQQTIFSINLILVWACNTGQKNHFVKVPLHWL